MTTYRLVSQGIGINTMTYFKLAYFIFADDEQQYGILHLAVFGRN